MKIVSLDKKQYKGYEIDVSYYTKANYLVKVKKSKGIHLIIKKKRFFRKQEKISKIKLFEDYIENAQVYAVFERKKIIAIIEGAIELKNSCYHIWNIFVSKRHRREGIGGLIYKHIEEEARILGARAITIEVDSFNEPLLAFYQHQGFHFIGLNTIAKSNDDVQKREVTLTYGKRL